MEPTSAFKKLTPEEQKQVLDACTPLESLLLQSAVSAGVNLYQSVECPPDAFYPVDARL